MAYFTGLLLLLTGLHLVFFGWVAFNLVLDFRALPELANATADVASPKVSIIVPARNEASKIDRCLASLAAQTYPAFEVILVNDRSTDDTGTRMHAFAARNAQFSVVEGVEPAPGEAGKVHALLQALPVATGEFLLFIDADTCLHPMLVARTIASMQADRLDMLSLTPHLECKTFWEWAILPTVVLLIGLRYPLHRVNDPNTETAIANGQFMLFRREAYERLGTHRAVLHSIVEDLDMARRAKRQGLRYRLFDGARLFSVRMYTSFAELREGWTKNMYLSDPQPALAIALGRVCGLWWIGLYPIAALIAGAALSSSILQWGALTDLAWMLAVVGLSRMLYRAYPASSLLFPLGMAVLGTFYWESRQRSLSATGVAWKGRYYNAARHAHAPKH